MWCTVVHTGAVVTTSLSPAMSSDRIRLTISVTPEVHAIFTRMAEVAGVSLGKCMGDWLADTSEGAQFVAQKMEDARKAPRVVMREMQAFARGLVDEVDATAEALRRTGSTDARTRAARTGRSSAAPSSNTGLNPPGKGGKQA